MSGYWTVDSLWESYTDLGGDSLSVCVELPVYTGIVENVKKYFAYSGSDNNHYVKKRESVPHSGTFSGAFPVGERVEVHDESSA